MIILPETPITDASFDKWKSHRIDVEEGEESYYYFVIPLIDVDEKELERIEEIPALFSSESDNFIDSESGKTVFTVRMFDEDLPELTTEEEVEILYKILTKKELFCR
jgi:hypothetical protein